MMTVFQELILVLSNLGDILVLVATGFQRLVQCRLGFGEWLQCALYFRYWLLYCVSGNGVSVEC